MSYQKRKVRKSYELPKKESNEFSIISQKVRILKKDEKNV